MNRASRWILPSCDLTRVDALARELGIQRPAARVLANRGYGDPDAARRFLNPHLSYLHDPLRLKDVDRAAARLQQAIAAGERMLLYGDYDVDGTTSIVILKKAVELAGGRADFHVPHRLKDGYGMRPEVIDRAAADGIRLIISVDTGIRASAVVAHAQALGIDVIVTDHHLPEAALPPALAVVNPNRPDCEYPEKNLCGAGVTFKLVQALWARLGWSQERIRKITESFLKLVAIATVADVVPLTGENRVIVKLGLDGLHSVRNEGLRALLRVAGFHDGDRPSAGQVAFRIAPRINAAGRMDTAEDVINLFLTDDRETAERLAAQLHDLNRERQETEAQIVNIILEACSQAPVTDAQAALVFSGKDWHRGVVGIVASRVVERFHRPVFVLGEDEESGTAQGSGRSISAFHLLEALESMPELFTKFGGHRQAAGLTLAMSDVQIFRDRLNAYALTKLTSEDLRPVMEPDALLQFNELTERTVEEILALAPFGCGNSAPMFAVLGGEVCGTPALWNEKHLRVPIRQNGRTIVVKAWNFAGRMQDLPAGCKLDFALCLEEDPYSRDRGFPGWCAVLKDVRPSEAAASA
ncbi:MAG: single-stranded-DNA-specific exonuclease RecJ [Bryobacteraceae bacterium]